MDADERRALLDEGLDPDDPRVASAIDLVRCEAPWVSRRLGLLDSDQGLVGPVCIVERGFELRG
ncbi:hypothetical protein, partial [Mycolicibacterium phlei]|uniref:hypothetical protein n=1 Tax=Mycolicibacterium phlei TaxID=1771 RepID=UPI001F26F84D